MRSNAKVLELIWDVFRVGLINGDAGCGWGNDWFGAIEAGWYCRLFCGEGKNVLSRFAFSFLGDKVGMVKINLVSLNRF